jgi:hypothetical protein
LIKVIKELNVEVTKPNIFQAIVAKQYDMNSRFLKVTLVDNGSRIDIPNSNAIKVVINAERADGQSKGFDGVVNDDGTVTVPLHSWMLELEGVVVCDISVIDTSADNEKKLTTTTFTLLVEKAAYGGIDITADPQYDVLVEAIGRINGILENGDKQVTQSAYEIAKQHGYNGTLSEWVLSLKGGGGESCIITDADKAEIANEVVNTVTEKIPYTNILDYRHEVETKEYGDDWTRAIEKALSDLTEGGTLYFPRGEYKHTGIKIEQKVRVEENGKIVEKIVGKRCQIIGESRYSTILKNMGTGASVTFGIDTERSMFRDIAIVGSGPTQVDTFYSNEAQYVAGNYGFKFGNNSSILTFERVYMKGHGDDFFYGYGVGHINNINIIDCQLEFGMANAITFIQKDANNQINSINIKDTNISRFKKNGINLWGNAITVSGCAIQVCYENGININITKDQKTVGGYGHTQGVNILNNYFEQCYNSFIRVDAWFNFVAPGSPDNTYAYVHGLRLEGNFGDFDGISDGSETKREIPSTAACVKISNMTATDQVDCLSGLVYQCNAFSAPIIPQKIPIVDGGGTLSERNYFYVSRMGGVSDADHILQFENLGNATILSDIRNGLTPYVKDGNWWIGDRDTGIKIGADYVLTEADKTEIAGKVPMVRVAESPTWVDNVSLMTDTNKNYVLEDSGMIYAYVKRTTFYPSQSVTNEFSVATGTLFDGKRVETATGVTETQESCVASDWIDVSNFNKPCTLHLTGIRWGNPSWTSYTPYVGFTTKNAEGVIERIGQSCTDDNVTNVIEVIINQKLENNKETYSDITVKIKTDNISAIKFSGTYLKTAIPEEWGTNNDGIGVGSANVAKIELSGIRKAYTETKSDWFDTGHAYNQPADYENRVAELERKVNDLQVQLHNQ